MIAVDIPGAGELRLSHLVCDCNGTLTEDGVLLPGVADGLRDLAADLHIHVVTADTFGQAASQLRGLPVELIVLDRASGPAGVSQAEAKREYVTRLGAEGVAALGNGRNDALMLSAARLGIVLVQREGASAVAVAAADVVVTNVSDALSLLRSPRRLIATLRT